MPTKNCPQCAGHDFLNCLRDRFGAKLAKLLQDTLEQVKTHTLETQTIEDTPEIKDRKECFPIELADHLLWLAATVYTGEGIRGSEAIYELSKAIEEVEFDEDEDPTEVDLPGPLSVPNNDVN